MRTSRSSAVVTFTGFALVALLAGCSSSKSLGGGATSTAVALTTTTVPDPSTTPAPSTPVTSAPSGSCTDATPSGSAVQVTLVDGDWNGDGAMDTAQSWGEPTGGGADWFVRLRVNGGSNSVVSVGDVGAGFLQALGRIDVDFALGAEPGVNKDELLSIVGTNAAGYNLGVFGLDESGCAVQFDSGGTEPYIIPVHAAAATMSGMMCDGGMGSRFLVRLEAETADGTNWDVRYVKVERTGPHSLADGTVVTDTLSGASAVASFGRAECDGVEFIGGGADY